MARHAMFARKGPWIFVVAVCMYLGVNVVLDVRYTAQRDVVESDRFVTERIDVAQLTSVSIAMPVESYAPVIDIQYSNQADVSVAYDKHTIRMQQRAENKTLHIEFAEVERYSRGRDEITVVLPVTLKTLVLQSQTRVRVREYAHKLTDLSIQLDDCDSSAELGVIKVDALRLSSACDQLRSENYRSIVFAMDGTQVKKLDVFMRSGALELKDTARVSSINLNVSDEVSINAPASMLRKAHWGQASSVAAPVPQ
jgi:hypothetical protein